MAGLINMLSKPFRSADKSAEASAIPDVVPAGKLDGEQCAEVHKSFLSFLYADDKIGISLLLHKDIELWTPYFHLKPPGNAREVHRRMCTMSRRRLRACSEKERQESLASVQACGRNKTSCRLNLRTHVSGRGWIEFTCVWGVDDHGNQQCLQMKIYATNLPEIIFSVGLFIRGKVLLPIRGEASTALKKLDPRDPKVQRDYGIGEELGKGAFGRVSIALDQKSHEVRAVKLMKKTGDPQQDEDVATEIQLMHTVAGSPYVVRLFQVYEDDEKYSLVLELVLGGELKKRLRGRPDRRFSEPEAREAMRDLLMGLQWLAACHVVHRDLKPANLLLAAPEPCCRIKITDFGLSALCDDDYHLKEHVGTPLFMAQARPRAAAVVVPRKLSRFASFSAPERMLSRLSVFSFSAACRPELLMAGSWRSVEETTGCAITTDRTPVLLVRAFQQHKRADDAWPRARSGLAHLDRPLSPSPPVSPRSLSASGTYGHSVDVWSAGAILFTMLAGAHPLGVKYKRDKRVGGKREPAAGHLSPTFARTNQKPAAGRRAASRPIRKRGDALRFRRRRAQASATSR